MAMAIVTVKANNGDECHLRVLLDSASEINFITLAACKRLNIKLDEMCKSISELNNMSCAINRCRILMKSRTSKFELSLYYLVVPKITKNLLSFFIKFFIMRS